MLDSQSRLPAHDARHAGTWEEATFTRPMRSPFASAGLEESAPRPSAKRESQGTIARSEPPAAEIDVCIEEAALFEAPRPLPRVALRAPALRRRPTPPPPQRSSLPPPRFDAEATCKQDVSDELLAAMRGERDSVQLRQAVRAAAAVDLGKTVEEPTLGAEVCLARSHSGVRKR